VRVFPTGIRHALDVSVLLAAACLAAAGPEVDLDEHDVCTERTRDDSVASFVDRESAIIGIEGIDLANSVFVVGHAEVPTCRIEEAMRAMSNRRVRLSAEIKASIDGRLI
jgi:hypothetical protein